MDSLFGIWLRGIGLALLSGLIMLIPGNIESAIGTFVGISIGVTFIVLLYRVLET